MATRSWGSGWGEAQGMCFPSAQPAPPPILGLGAGGAVVSSPFLPGACSVLQAPMYGHDQLLGCF